MNIGLFLFDWGALIMASTLALPFPCLVLMRAQVAAGTALVTEGPRSEI